MILRIPMGSIGKFAAWFGQSIQLTCWTPVIVFCWAGPAALAASPTPDEATLENEYLPPSELLLEIDRAEDYFRWYRLRQVALERGLDDTDVSAALDNKLERLR